MIVVGTASWRLPTPYASDFPGEGTHLQRYAKRLDGVEINTSFYGQHRAATYARWRDETPDGFRFAVKLIRSVTHERRLRDADEPLDRFLEDTSALGDKLGPILVQLPPSLMFDPWVAAEFFRPFRKRYAGPVVIAPRHPTWFGAGARDLLIDYQIAGVVADPVRPSGPVERWGWNGVHYYRLHGSPRIYWSRYSPGHLDELARLVVREPSADVWVVFDNTAAGYATTNALELQAKIAARSVTSR